MARRCMTGLGPLLAAFLAACGGGDPEPERLLSDERAQALAQSPGDGLGDGSGGGAVCIPPSLSEVVTPDHAAFYLRDLLCDGWSLHQVGFQNVPAQYPWRWIQVNNRIRYPQAMAFDERQARCANSQVEYRMERLHVFNGLPMWVTVSSGILQGTLWDQNANDFACMFIQQTVVGPQPGGATGTERIWVRAKVPDGSRGRLITQVDLKTHGPSS